MAKNTYAQDPKAVAFYAKREQHKRTQSYYRSQIQQFGRVVQDRSIALWMEQLQQIQQLQANNDYQDGILGLQQQAFNPSIERSENIIQNDNINQDQPFYQEQYNDYLESNNQLEINPNEEIQQEQHIDENKVLDNSVKIGSTVPEKVQNVFTKYSQLFAEETSDIIQPQDNQQEDQSKLIQKEPTIEPDQLKLVSQENNEIQNKEITINDCQQPQPSTTMNNIQITNLYENQNCNQNKPMNTSSYQQDTKPYNLSHYQETNVEYLKHSYTSSISSEDSLLKLMEQRNSRVLELKDLYYNSRLLSLDDKIIKDNRNKITYTEQKVVYNNVQKPQKQQQQYQQQQRPQQQQIEPSNKLQNLVQSVSLYSNEAAQMYWNGFLNVKRRSNWR